MHRTSTGKVQFVTCRTNTTVVSITEALKEGAAPSRSCKDEDMSDDAKPKKQFVSHNRRPSLDRLAGVGTPPSGRYFQGYAEQVALNLRMHSLDSRTIKGAVNWARTKGYLSASE